MATLHIRNLKDSVKESIRIRAAVHGRSMEAEARAILEDDHGVKPSDIIWVRAGLEQAGRVEKIELAMPKDVRIEDAPTTETLNAMLDRGEIDGFRPQ